MSSGSAEKTASTTTRRNSRPSFVGTLRRTHEATVSESSRRALGAAQGRSSGIRAASRSIRAWASPSPSRVGTGRPNLSSA